MSVTNNINFLQAQLVDTQRMLDLVKDHPLMSYSLSKKIEQIKNQLSAIPHNFVESKLRMLFSGKAVKGSRGIKSSFVAKTISPLQELVKTQAALTRFGTVSKRGNAKNSVSSELYLTALPIGSFGLELSQLETNDLFDENDFTTSIQKVIFLIAETAGSEIAFEETVSTIPKRSLNNLKRFLKEVAEEDSMLKMESGNIEVYLSDESVKLAYNRVASTNTEEEEIFISGILRGFLLESGRFEIIDNTGKRYYGFISEELSENEIIDYDQKFLNKPCKVHLLSNKIIYKTGNERIAYELLGISEL